MSSTSNIGPSSTPPWEAKQLQKKLTEVDKAETRLFKEIMSGKRQVSQHDIANLKNQVTHLDNRSDQLSQKQKTQLNYLKIRLARIEEMLGSHKPTLSTRSSKIKSLVKSTFDQYKMKKEAKSITQLDLQLTKKLEDKSTIEAHLKAIVSLENAIRKYPDSPQVKEWKNSLTTLQNQAKAILTKETSLTQTLNEPARKNQYAELYFEFVKMQLIISQLNECVSKLDIAKVEIMGLTEARDALHSILNSFSENSPALQLLNESMLTRPADTLRNATQHIQVIKDIGVPTSINSANFEICMKQIAYTFSRLPLLSEIHTQNLTKEQFQTLKQTATVATNRNQDKASREQIIKSALNNPELKAQFVQFNAKTSLILKEIAKNSPQQDQEQLIDLLYESKHLAEQLQRTA